MRLLLVGLVLLSPWAQSELVIEEGYVRGLPPGQPNTAAFMRLSNNGEQPLTVVGVGSDVAKRAEIHRSTVKNGLMHMEKLADITIAAGATFELTPGANHLMLMGLEKTLVAGDSVKLRFSLKNGSQHTATLKVRSVLDEHHHH